MPTSSAGASASATPFGEANRSDGSLPTLASGLAGSSAARTTRLAPANVEDVARSKTVLMPMAASVSAAKELTPMSTRGEDRSTSPTSRPVASERRWSR